MKFEKAGPYQTPVIDQTKLYTTDEQTDRQVQTNIPPSSSKGDIKMKYLFDLRKCFVLQLLLSEIAKLHRHDKVQTYPARQ